MNIRLAVVIAVCLLGAFALLFDDVRRSVAGLFYGETAVDQLEDSLAELELPRGDAPFAVEDIPLLTIESSRFLVSPGVAQRRTVPWQSHPQVGKALNVEDARNLREVLSAVNDVERGEASLARKPYDDTWAVAMDRCLPMARLFAGMREVWHLGSQRFALVSEDADGEPRFTRALGGLIRWREGVEDGDLAEYMEFHIAPEGITVMVDHVPVAPLEGCPADGPTLCSFKRQRGPCGEPTQDWSRLHQLVAAKAEQWDTVFLIQTARETRWQSVVELINTVRWQPSAENEVELLPDPVFYLEPLQEPMLSRHRGPNFAE